ncbi:MAG: hypothetical protein IKN63_05965 [Bacilli bacterium]|nr:hypothetical protein [Bacilli bacterium]
MNDYSDIIDFDYQGPKNHVRMPKESRAFQFGSFRALSGYDEELKEARRIVSEQIILSEDQKYLLDQKLQEIKNNINSNPQIKITYFIKDLKKYGGFYKTIITNIKKIDFPNKEIILFNKEKILIKNIINIDII